MDSREGEGAPGEESGEGETLVAQEWLGQWRRRQLPEMGKKTSPGRLAANGVLGRWLETACVRRRARGSLNRRSGSVPRRPGIRLPATVFL